MIIYINNFNKHIEKFEFKNYTLYIDIDTIVFLGSLTNTQISIDKLTIFLIFKKFKTNSFNAHYLQKTMNNFENYFKLLKFVILNSPIFSKLTNEDEFDIIKIKFKTTINTYNKKYLCLKHNEKEFFNVYSVIHKQLTGKDNAHILEFGHLVSDAGIPMWIRRVLVPGLTDDEDDLQKTAEYIKTLKTVKKIEVLPYHSMGEYKWKQLGYDYPLDGQLPPSDELVKHAEEILGKAI